MQSFFSTYHHKTHYFFIHTQTTKTQTTLQQNIKTQDHHLELFCYEGTEVGLSLSVEHTTQTLGRSRDCTLAVDDIHIPRKALKIYCHNNQFYYQTLSSRVQCFKSSYSLNLQAKSGILQEHQVFTVGHQKFVVRSYTKSHPKEILTLTETSHDKKPSETSTMFHAASLITSGIVAIALQSPYFLLFAGSSFVTTGLIKMYKKYFAIDQTHSPKELKAFTPLLAIDTQLQNSHRIVYGTLNSKPLQISSECSCIYIYGKDAKAESLLRWLLLVWVPSQSQKVHVHGRLPAWLHLLVENFELHHTLPLFLCSTPLCQHQGPHIHFNCPHSFRPKDAIHSIDIDFSVPHFAPFGVSWQYFFNYLLQKLPQSLTTKSFEEYILDTHHHKFFLGRHTQRQESIWLDLIHDGPHFVLAGTTGSGKTELLHSIIFSLCAHQTPEEISIFLCDFKGGTGFSTVKNLPHLSYFLSNTQLQEARRALDLLSYEISKRERILNELKLKSIQQYRTLQHQPKIPTLLVIIDEFRILHEELPEKIPVLIRCTSVGRSLGIHVIFSSQNMQGLLQNSIKANIGSFISLKARNAEDSYELLHCALATTLENPGEGFLNQHGKELVPFKSLISDHSTTSSTRDSLLLSCQLALGEVQEKHLSCKTIKEQNKYKALLEQKLYQYSPYSLFPPALPPRIWAEDILHTITGQTNTDQIFLARSDIPLLGQQQPFFWNFSQTRFLCAGNHDKEQQSFFAAFLLQALTLGKKCVVIADPSKYSSALSYIFSVSNSEMPVHKNLLFFHEISEAETFIMLCEEKFDLLFIDQWENFYHFLKHARSPLALQRLEEYVLSKKKIVVFAGPSFFQWHLNHLFHTKIVFPFIDKSQHILHGNTANKYKDLAASQAILVTESLSPDNVSQVTQLKAHYKNQKPLPDEESSFELDSLQLRPLEVPQEAGLYLGLRNSPFTWNFIQRKSIIVTAATENEAFHILENIVTPANPELIQIFDCNDATKLNFPTSTEVLAIQSIHKASENVDQHIVHLLNEGDVAICLLGSYEDMVFSRSQALKYAQQQKYGIILNPKHTNDGQALGQRIKVLPQTIPQRGILLVGLTQEFIQCC